MSDQIFSGEHYSTVPWTYVARLERTVHVPTGSDREQTKAVNETMTVAGKVHPQPYGIEGATAATMGRLAGVVADGWHVVSTRIFAYGERD